MTLAHLLLTEGGTQQVTRCKHKHNDNRGKISDARESAVTLCCVAFFIHLPPPLMCGVYCVCGAQVCGPGQAVPGARAGSGQGWWRGRAQSWRRHESGDTDSDTQGESGQRGDTETRENIINSDICGEIAENTTECDSDQERITSSEKSGEPGSVYRWSAWVW